MSKKWKSSSNPRVQNVARELLESASRADEEGRRQAAIQMYWKSLRLGSPEAAVNLGNIYSSEKNSIRNIQVAKRLYRVAYRRGCVYGATALGMQYRSEGNNKAARSWLRRAADQGEEWAEEALREMPT